MRKFQRFDQSSLCRNSSIWKRGYEQWIQDTFSKDILLSDYAIRLISSAQILASSTNTARHQSPASKEELPHVSSVLPIIDCQKTILIAEPFRCLRLNSSQQCLLTVCSDSGFRSSFLEPEDKLEIELTLYLSQELGPSLKARGYQLDSLKTLGKSRAQNVKFIPVMGQGEMFEIGKQVVMTSNFELFDGSEASFLLKKGAIIDKLRAQLQGADQQRSSYISFAIEVLNSAGPFDVIKETIEKKYCLTEHGFFFKEWVNALLGAKFEISSDFMKKIDSALKQKDFFIMSGNNFKEAKFFNVGLNCECESVIHIDSTSFNDHIAESNTKYLTLTLGTDNQSGGTLFWRCVPDFDWKRISNLHRNEIYGEYCRVIDEFFNDPNNKGVVEAAKCQIQPGVLVYGLIDNFWHCSPPPNIAGQKNIFRFQFPGLIEYSPEDSD